MQIGQQGGRLFIGKAPGKGGHHPLPGQNHTLDLGIGGSGAAGQRLLLKDAVQVWRNFLQSQIVVLVAMGAAGLVEVLALRLLLRKLRNRTAAGRADAQAES
jgi:hypothetical protein